MGKLRPRKGHSMSKVMWLLGGQSRRGSSPCLPQVQQLCPRPLSPKDSRAPRFHLPWPLGPRVRGRSDSRGSTKPSSETQPRHQGKARDFLTCSRGDTHVCCFQFYLIRTMLL